MSWRVADIDATRARLVAAGLDVSEVRNGRKPGTRIMTVRNGTCGIPTVLLERVAEAGGLRGAASPCHCEELGDEAIQAARCSDASCARKAKHARASRMINASGDHRAPDLAKAKRL